LVVVAGSHRADVRGNTIATEGIAPRRLVLDKILLDGAVRANMEVREGFNVAEILTTDDGTVTGIRGTPKLQAARSHRQKRVVRRSTEEA
jgi:hypothetical protein